jgi:hypothetical protein
LRRMTKDVADDVEGVAFSSPLVGEADSAEGRA